MPPTTRLFALLNRSKVTDEAKQFFRTIVEFDAILVRTWGTQQEPWVLLGITRDGGSVGHVRFGTFAEAKEAAERYFGLAMGEWQEPPRDQEPGEYIAKTFFPGYIDWRVGSGPVEREQLYRAKLRFTRYDGRNDHEHCRFCWAEFFIPTAESPGHGKPLLHGFTSEDLNDWVCEPCYYALRDILEFDAEVP